MPWRGVGCGVGRKNVKGLLAYRACALMKGFEDEVAQTVCLISIED